MSPPQQPTGLGLFDGVLARGPVREAFSDRAWLAAMLAFEAALARACARAGVIEEPDARAITEACGHLGLDAFALARDAAATGSPVPPLVRALTAAVPGKAKGAVHRGATSQDVIDTAAMLVAHRALGPLLEDLNGAADAAAALARAHRLTPMAGRTLLQQALPTTFGLEAAAWLSGLDEAAERLEDVRRRRLAVQLGGGVGTLASLGDAGPAVVGFLAEELGLNAPLLPWHTVRTRVAELASALGEAAGALGKPARDVVLLAQTEIAEVREGGEGGGSSTLPQKRNPVAAVSVLASAAQAPGLVATILAAMVQEHQRAAGAWHAEWRPLTDLLVAVGSAAAWLRECLGRLQVDAPRMRANLDRTGGLLLAERVTTALTAALGRLAAHDLVVEACAESASTGRPLAEALLARPPIAAQLSASEVQTLLDPAGYLGSAGLFVDRALEAHAARGRSVP
jgi:3-carboxy-cis,cis-muconate cycloisomerase